MKHITSGTEILFNKTAGRLLKYQEHIKKIYPPGSILLAEKLSNDLAIDALNSGANGIITRKTSFAAHGANILRGSDNKIAWITNVDVDLLTPFEDSYIYIDSQGNIFSSLESDSIVEESTIYPSESIHYNFSSPPLNDTSVIDYNLNTNETWICFWKYNYFSNYIFSSLSQGIQIEFEMLFHHVPKVKRDGEGKVWVETTITHNTMLKYCCNPQNLLNYMMKVKKNYTQILELMSQNILTTSFLEDWLIRYYSTFSLIHRSYDYVLYELYETISKAHSSTIAVNYMNYLMNSKIDRWLVEQHGTINNSKAFMVPEKILPIPYFTIDDDIQEAIEKTETFFENNGLTAWYNQNSAIILSGCYLFVIKEWKFVLYKLLTSRCYHFYSQCVNLATIDIAESSYSEMEELYGDQKVIIPHN